MAESVSMAAGYGIHPRAADEPPEGVPREVALLLADTPEAALFFETRGDLAGRELRHRCQARIARAVAARGGRIARTAGDATWAYFSEPRDALSAAVSIRDAFREPPGDGNDRIGVRIGLHFGEVILERRDLVGHVVHQLDRLVQAIEPGRIALTAAFRDSGRRRGGIPFALDPLPPEIGDGFFLAGPESAESRDAAGTIQLLLEPLWPLAVPEFAPVWKGLAAARHRLRASRPVTSEILPDGALRFVLDDPAAAARLGRAALDHLAEGLGAAAGGLVPARATVDIAGRTGPVEGERMPGEIHLSPEAAADASDLPVRPEGPPDHPPTHFRYRPEPPETPAPFRFAAALGVGPGPPCFHCGARRHDSATCPTHRNEDRPDALERLGYLHPDEINRLFLRFLSGDDRPLADGTKPGRAGQAFEALKRVHQLGFFRRLWRSSAERWDDVDDPRFQGRNGRGGRAWLALDCLRNGRLPEAEALLDAARKAAPSDFRIHAASGFLAVDRGNLPAADGHFEQAQFHARSTPESLFALLQRYRLALLDDRMLEAEKYLERALSIDAGCGSAQYAAAAFRLRRNEIPSGVEAVLALAEADRTFYLHALIDPDLTPGFSGIRDGLGRLYRSARDDAAAWMPRAGGALARAREWLGPEDRTVAELTARYGRLSELQKRGGYFGLLDAADGARAIQARAERTVRLRREGLFDLLQRQENRFHALEAQWIGAGPVPGPLPGPLTDPLRAEIRTIGAEVSDLRKGLRGEAGESLRAISGRLDDLDARLSRTEFRFAIWNAWRQGLRFLGAFSKSCLVFQSINLLIGLLLVPTMIRVLALFTENWQVPLPYLRLSQMGTLLVGGILGFLVAVFRALRKMESDAGPSDS